jgi:hypothetical protein
MDSQMNTLPDEEVFTCWKQIAAYMNRGVRTVQRWEASEGLPVRRPNGNFHGYIYASSKDLDRWLASRSKNWKNDTTPAQPRRSENKLPALSEFRSALQQLLVECEVLANQITDTKR